MKLLALIAIALVGACGLSSAAEVWPTEALAYEQLAARTPQAGVAFERLWSFASGVGQLDALQARWEAAARADGGWNWSVLAGLLAERRGAIEEARNHFRHATEVAPSHFAPWLALGEFEARQRMPGAGAAFEKALTLDDPEQPRAVAALAAWYQAAGRAAQSRAAVESRFEAAQDPALRLALTPPLAEACFADGTLAALVEGFETRQRGGDWRFGIYLAEIDTVARDYAAARARLEELRASHPDDLLVAQQAAKIARLEKRPVELAKLLRFCAERTNDRRAWRKYFVAMLETGHPAECARLLAEHPADIGAQPSFWRAQIPRLGQFDLLDAACRAIESQLGTAGWEGRLVLGELLIAAGREREAPPHFWQVLEATAPAITAQAQETGNSLGSIHLKNVPSFPGESHASRIEGMKLMRKDFSKLVTSSSDLAEPFAVTIETLQDAREEALYQLALLAQFAGEETEFVARLPLALRDWPAGERVLAYATIGNAPGLSREIATYAAGPDRQPEADRFCAALLAKMSGPPDELARLKATFSSTEAAPTRPTATVPWYAAFRRCFDAFIAGDFERAGIAFEEGLAAQPPPDQLDSFKLSLAHGLRGLRDGRKTTEAAAFALACIYPRELPHATLSQPMEYFRVLPHNEPVFNFDLLFDVAGPNYYLMGSNYFTPPRLWINQSLNTAIWMVMDNVGEDRRAEVLARIARQPQELTGARGQFARLGIAYFAWWMNRKDVTETQLRALLAAVPRDELRIALAGLLTDTGRHAEALTLLAQIKPARPGERQRLETWRERVAAAGRNESVVTDDEDAAEPPPWLRVHDPNTTLSLADAREVLAIAPAVAQRWRSLRTSRTAAWKAIENAGERERFTAALRDAAGSGGSLATWQRLAEAEQEPDRILAACERIFALDPHNSWAVRRLAAKTETNGTVLPRVEAAIEHRLEELMPEPGDELWRLFENANELPRLAAAIDRATPGFLARDSSTLVSRLDNAAEMLHSLALDDSAIRVWRKALFLSSPEAGNGASIRQKLAAALARGKDRAASIDIVAELLFPTPPKRVLFDAISPPKASEAISNMALIKTGIGLGGLAELRRRGEAAASASKGPRLTLNLVRTLGRDPVALAELSAAAQSFSNASISTLLIVTLAEELSDWPEAQAACLALVAAHARLAPKAPAEERLRIAKVAARAGGTDLALKIAREILQAPPPVGASAQHTLRLIAEVATAAHAPDLVRDCGRRWLEQEAQARKGDMTEAFKLTGLLADVGCVEEERLMIAALRGNEVVRRDASWQNRLRIFDIEAGLKRGDVQQLAPIVWLDADRSAGEEATLVWDIGAIFERGETTQPVTTGAPLPTMNGRFTIELLFGEEAGAMRTLARLPHAAARGVWRGTLPAPSGLVRAVLWDGDHAVFSDPLPAFRGPNLLRGKAGDDPAWGLALNSVQRVEGGPAIDGEYFSFKAAEPASEQPIAGRRVKLTTGRDYVLSGWIRGTGPRSVRIGWHCLNAKGAVIHSGENAFVVTSDRVWSYSWSRLTWPQADGRSSQLSADAKYLEPVIEGGSAGFDLASLSLVEVPESERHPSP